MSKKTSRPLRLGIIGCGEHAAENLLPSLLQIEEADLVALCDIDVDRLKNASRVFSKAAIFTSFENLYRNEALDAVILAGPPQMHFEAAQIALTKGIHVFVEKPPTVTTSELLRLAELARDKSIITAVGHNLRYTTACQLMEKLISKKSFGRRISMDIRYIAAQPKGCRWGLKSVIHSFMLSHAIHAIDLLLAHMGSVSELSAMAIQMDNGAVLISVHFQFETGGIGTLVTGTCGPHFQIDIRLIGETSTVVQVDSLHEVTVYGLGNDPKRWGRSWHPRPLEAGYSHAGYLGELRSFISSIRSGKPHLPSLIDEIEVYKLVDEIEKQISRDC